MTESQCKSSTTEYFGEKKKKETYLICQRGIKFTIPRTKLIFDLLSPPSRTLLTRSKSTGMPHSPTSYQDSNPAPAAQQHHCISTEAPLQLTWPQINSPPIRVGNVKNARWARQRRATNWRHASVDVFARETVKRINKKKTRKESQKRLRTLTYKRTAFFRARVKSSGCVKKNSLNYLRPPFNEANHSVTSNGPQNSRWRLPVYSSGKQARRPRLKPRHPPLQWLEEEKKACPKTERAKGERRNGYY